MSIHRASIAWHASPGEFDKGRFSRAHRWSFDGGLTVAASASPTVIPPPWSDPAGVDPEEAFVAAIASCHMMSFLYLANRAGHEVTDYRDDAEGRLGKKADGQRWMERVTLYPRVAYVSGTAPDAAAEARLHEQAHTICFIANSVATPISIEPSAYTATSNTEDPI